MVVFYQKMANIFDEIIVFYLLLNIVVGLLSFIMNDADILKHSNRIYLILSCMIIIISFLCLVIGIN